MHDLIVETTAGKLRGERRGDVAIWKGIPYAAPPLGALRFRPPEPPAPWPGVRDATEFAPVAAQSRDPRIALMSGVTDKVQSGEDCLYLNVFAPATPGPHPVMVWIHGGAFIMGSGSTPLYHGMTFADQGIVTVTLNYRLGLPGLLYLGDLAPGYDAGDCFLLDQVAALRWVKDNIVAFGGDSRPGHGDGRVRRRDLDQHAARDARRARPVPPRHPRERRPEAWARRTAPTPLR